MNYRTESWSRTSSQTARRARHQWRGAVESLEQKQLLATFTVSDFGSDPATPHTLAWAITQANTYDGLDTIDFNLGSGGRQRILLTSELPEITDFVLIDGTTQPGFNPTDSIPIIEVSGEYIGTTSTIPPFYFDRKQDVNGFVINTGDSDANTTTLKGLAIGCFMGSGIEIVNSTNVEVKGNYIGIDSDLCGCFENLLAGVYVHDSKKIQIGGISEQDFNVIMNNSSGIVFSNVTTGAIQGNFIGVDRSGLVHGPNLYDGINVTDSSGILIGVETPTHQNPTPFPAPPDPPTDRNDFLTYPLGQNVIDGNKRDGVVIWGTLTGNLTLGSDIYTNKVVNNRIINNSANGVKIGDNASNNLIQQNSIKNNGDIGIAVLSGNYNALYANQYYKNGKLGIDLNYDGSTPNDEGDLDRGANENINYPDLQKAISGKSTTTITGTYQGAANTTLSIQLYANNVPISNPAQAELYLGYINVTTDLDGVASFTFITNYRLEAPKVIDPTLPPLPSKYITAIASDTKGNTSEISSAIPVEAALSPDMSIELKCDPAETPLNSSTVVTALIKDINSINATNVIASIFIPSDFIITDITPSGLTIQSDVLIDNNYYSVVTASYGSFQAGDTQTITISLSPTKIGLYLIKGTVTESEEDANPLNNSDDCQIEVTPSAPLPDIKVTSSIISPVPQCGTTTLITTFQNIGLVTATNVVMTINVPAGFTVTGTTPLGITPIGLIIKNNVITATYSSLAVNDPAQINLQLKASITSTNDCDLSVPVAVGSYTVVSSATSNESDLNPANNSASSTITVVQAQPPHVISVQRLINKRRMSVRLTFDEPMDLCSVENASNYYFTVPGKDGKFGTADDKTIGAQSAIYNPLTFSVLVTPYQPHTINTRPARVTVIGVTQTGVKSDCGIALDGGRLGKPSNFLSVVPLAGTILKTSAIAKARRLIR